MEDLAEERPASPESWARWVALALVLSLLLHAGFVWWASHHPVRIFQEIPEQPAPRAFRVDRVETEAQVIPDEPATPEDPAAKPALRPSPVNVAPIDFGGEKAVARPAAPKPGQLGIEKEPVPKVGLESGASALNLAKATAMPNDDLNAMRRAMAGEMPTAPAQPALEIARTAGNPGAEGENSVPQGYSDLDQLLGQTGGLSEEQAPIYMPSAALFDYDQSVVRPEAITELGKLGELMRKHPEVRFNIEGHTDSFGGFEYNARLSLARAEAVKTWLVQQAGVDPSRLGTRGLGSTKPIAATEGTVEEQQPNRRVEVVILSPDRGQ